MAKSQQLMGLHSFRLGKEGSCKRFDALTVTLGFRASLFSPPALTRHIKLGGPYSILLDFQKRKAKIVFPVDRH